MKEHEKEFRKEGYDPKQYLQEYFLKVDEEFDALYRFWCRMVKNLPKGGQAVELGVGPSLYTTIPLASVVDEIHLADLLDGNLVEIDRWMENTPGHFDWRDHIKHVLGLQGITPTLTEIEQRESQLRSKIRQLRHCDLRWSHPMGTQETFDLVTAHYCTEAVARSNQEWKETIKYVCSLVKPGGAFLLSVASNLSITRAYEGALSESLPVNISSKDVLDALTEAGMQMNSWEYIPGIKDDPYAGSILSLSFRPPIPLPEVELRDCNKGLLSLSGFHCTDRFGHSDDTEDIIIQELRNYPKLGLDKGDTGWALVVKQPIDKNHMIVQIKGTYVTEPSQYTLQIGENRHIRGDIWQIDDFIDHSCDPNCRIDVQGDSVAVVSFRPISVGEKLTFNYLTTEWDMEEPFDCKCGAYNCFKHIAGFRYLTDSQKQLLSPLLTPFIKQKLSERPPP